MKLASNCGCQCCDHIREGFYEKLWKDFVSLQRGDVNLMVKEVEEHRKRCVPIDWIKIWREHDKITKNLVSAIEQVEIERLVEIQLRGEE